MTEFNPHINRIVCAAIKFQDSTIVCSARHFDQCMHKQLENIHPNKKYWTSQRHTQGFIDKFGNFHDRESAYKIAIEANQIVRDHDITGELFSEHLY
jgi:hypothetical protein